MSQSKRTVEELYEQACQCLQGESSSYERGFRALKEAADLGHMKAQYNVGICLQQGLGTKPSTEEAYRYFELAAKQGHPRAYYMLGCYFALGLLFPISEDQALYYFHLAAEAGVSDAQYNLGVLLLKEPTRREEAVHYFTLAATQGNADAEYNLGICYSQGLGVMISRDEAIRYLERALKQKHPKAASALEIVLMAAYRPT